MGKNMLSTPLYESLEIKRDTRRIITRSLSAALWLFPFDVSKTQKDTQINTVGHGNSYYF